MPRRLRGLVPLLTLLALARGAAPAAAQAPLPDERAAAREFSFAAYRLRVAVLAEKAEIRAKVRTIAATVFTDRRCFRALEDVPAAREDDVLLVAGVLVSAPLYDSLRTPLERFLAEIERVPTADPALRSGRAGWRSQVELIHRLPAVADPCGAMAAWQAAGYAPSAAPIDPRSVSNPGLDAADGKLARAERRLRQLGVSRGAAHRFTGGALLQGIVEDELPEPEPGPVRPR